MMSDASKFLWGSPAVVLVDSKRGLMRSVLESGRGEGEARRGEARRGEAAFLVEPLLVNMTESGIMNCRTVGAAERG